MARIRIADLHIVVTPELRAWIERAAKADGRSKSDWVYRALEKLRAKEASDA